MGQIHRDRTDRTNERGITILLVAAAMLGILAMAALAVDIVALYFARSEAQRAADATALAAAKMFVFTGYTTNSSGTGITQSQLCVNGGAGGRGAANRAAESTLAQNLVVGQAATLQNISCDLTTNAENPVVTVTVQRTGLPTLFGRIWGAGAGSVSATAKAEAFNPSGGSVKNAVGSVKPWLLSNNSCAACTGGPFYFTSTYGLVGNGSFIGRTFSPQLRLVDSSHGPPGANQFYALDQPQPNLCPSNSAVQCTNVGTGPPGIFYHDNIACANTAFQFSCGMQIGSGQTVTVDTRSFGNLSARTLPGTECLIHASSSGLGQGQDVINVGPPITIDGGTNNPNPALRSITNISRSDSVATVPVYDGSNLCPGGTCNVTTQILGFLQLGITDVTGGGDLHAVIMNAAACNPANTGTPVSGGFTGPSPIPVRLISQ